MGAANLRQIGLSLSSELTTVPIAGLDDPHTSRVSIITYDETVNVKANFTELNSHADVSNVLLSLKVSNSSSAAGIEDAFWAAETMMIDCWIDTNEDCGINRQQAFVFIGASMK
uniref:VWFA domain-containing protein n=1 Tax=Acrobeloides nanus TaxID=290746 RepID=A0A914CVU3_9BILA